MTWILVAVGLVLLALLAWGAFSRRRRGIRGTVGDGSPPTNMYGSGSNLGPGRPGE